MMMCRDSLKETASIALLLVASLSLSGCGEDRDTSARDNINEAGVYARFDPSNGIIPFPNNLLFSGTTDGTLNIPVADANDYSDPQVAINALDGFSTVAPISATFSSSLDSDSLIAGETVRLFKVTLSGVGGAVTSIVNELVPDTDYVVELLSADSSQSTLNLLPMHPLEPNCSYLVTLSRGINGSDGHGANAEISYALAKGTSPLVDSSGASLYSALTDAQAQALEPVRQLTNAAEAAVENYTITADSAGTIADQSNLDIILSWSFTTQSIGNVLSSVWANTTAQTVVTSASGLTTRDVSASLPGIADIHVGTLQVPYYLTAAADSSDSAPLTTFWHGAAGSLLTSYNPTPVATSTQTIPLLMTLPNTASGHSKPAGGWPVVIFQHGITQDRTNLLAVADSLAAAGFAAVAIDLPLHGITDTSSPLYVTGLERTFDLDLIDNATKAAGADGTIDASGSHYLNLTNLLVGRDNLRQSVSDLMTLYASLGNIADLDGSQVYFVGHSLGAMMGLPFLTFETAIQDAVLAMPGGAIAKLLDGSAGYGPELETALAAAGITKGSVDYESFLSAAQTVLDSSDPINYTATSGNGRGVLLFEVVSGAGTLADQTIPNNVWLNAPATTVHSPTAGTDPLANGLGLQHVSTSTTGSDLQAWVRFNAGHHGSLLTPNDADGNADTLSAQVTVEMQSQMAAFLASGGSSVVISDSSVIATE